VASFPGTVKLAQDGNVLRGSATWADGLETKVELKNAGGHLDGRAERVDSSKNRDWAPLALERLPRVGETAPDDTDAPPLDGGAAGDLPALDWKRDGLYLRLEPSADGYKGKLVTKAGEVKLELDFTRTEDHRLIGHASVEPEKGWLVATGWVLALQPDGTLQGRCGWTDIDPATKSIARGGNVAHTFKPMKKVG
jgi:hypothetical protein